MTAKSLRPFWAYYGGKWRAAPRYPRAPPATAGRVHLTK